MKQTILLLCTCLFIPLLVTATPHVDSLRHGRLIFLTDGLQFASGLSLQWAGSSAACQLMELPPGLGEAQRVLWQEVYVHADLTVITYTHSPLITYEWVIYPGGDPASIAIQGYLPLGMSRGADTSVSANLADTFSQPVAWQDQGGMEDLAYPVAFVCNQGHITITVGDYEPAQVLTIRWTQ
jgi:hypothetical protein